MKKRDDLSNTVKTLRIKISQWEKYKEELECIHASNKDEWIHKLHQDTVLKIRSLEGELQHILDLVNEIPDETDRRVILGQCINEQTNVDNAEEVAYSERQTTRRKKQALGSFAELYKRYLNGE